MREQELTQVAAVEVTSNHAPAQLPGSLGNGFDATATDNGAVEDRDREVSGQGALDESFEQHAFVRGEVRLRVAVEQREAPGAVLWSVRLYPDLGLFHRAARCLHPADATQGGLVPSVTLPSPYRCAMVDGPEDFHAFRARREAELAEPYGWLTLQAFHWLPAEPSALAGLPGRWWADASQAEAHLEATADDGLVRDGVPVDGTDSFTAAEYGRAPWVDIGDRQVELMRRGGRLCIRVRARTSAARERFTRVPTFAYDPDWRLTGRFDPYPEIPEVVVDTIRPDLQQVVRPLGEVVFQIGGAEQRLAVTKGKYGWGVEFHDPTNDESTEHWRQLHFDPPADGSDSVVLDFNRTLNMWFAFTPYATCPAPIAGNVITVPVPVGERRVS